MGKIVWGTSMSLDGFVAGPDHAMSWMAVDWLPDDAGGVGPLVEQLAVATGAVLAGRRWHDALDRLGGLEGIYGGRWSGPVLVLTSRPEPASPYEGVRFVTGGIEPAVAAAREAAGGKDVVVFGPTLAAQCLDAGLLDEVEIVVAPILLGDGIRLYGGSARPSYRLEPLGLGPAGPYVHVRYRVIR